jgi:hypothetical protein
MKKKFENFLKQLGACPSVALSLSKGEGGMDQKEKEYFS